MSASGQMPSDYGQHWAPESVWTEYDRCLDCGAETGKPCWDLRFRHHPRRPTWRAHPCRWKIDVTPPAGRYAVATVPGRHAPYPMLDFPTAWRLARRGLVHLTWQCSYVQSWGALLCDCGAAAREFERLCAGVR